MNFAFMSFSCPELTFEEILKFAGDLGYVGVEPRVVSNHAHNIELDADADARAEFRKQAEDAGIAICCVATSSQYADPESSQENVEDTLKYIDLAADLGSPSLRVFGGRMGDGLSRDQAIDLVAESLSATAAHAEEKGVSICIETHDDWCDPAHVAAVMKKVDHPNIAVNWDIMHPVRAVGSTMDEAYDQLKPWVKHVHFHDGRTVDGKSELCPVGEGNIDHRRALELLMNDGWDGYMSGEWIGWEPHDVHLPRELEIMKGYEKELSG